MSDSIRRRSSSRQMLQNLIRVTAQRSREDAEEAERERRRRARERPRDEESSPEAPERSELPHDTAFDDDVKPCSLLVLEEDEGFSDWSHRHEQEVPARCRVTEQRPAEPQWKPEPAEKERQEEDEQEGQEPSQRPTEEASSVRKGVTASFSSSVFLPQDSRTSYLVAGTMSPGCVTQSQQSIDPVRHHSGWACREEEQEEQEEQEEPEETKAAQLPEDEDDPKHSFTHKQADVCLKRETGREEEPMMRSAENGGGRTEDSEALAAPVLGSSYGPMSPTFKKLLIQFYPDEVNSRVSEKCTIMERTESLRRSTNSPKKTPPHVAVAKIDKKLEQYTQALEVSSKEGRSGCPALTDLTGPAEPVAFKKNLFEARDAANQNVSASSFKEADGLKVAVADLINQWVRGGEDGSGCSNPKAAASARDSSTAKKYRFVVTGHSKYEKVSVDGCEDASCQAAGLF